MREIDDTIKFGQETYRSMFIIRYNIYPRNFNEVVASHGWQVGILTLYLCEKFKNVIKLDIEKTLKMALIHDAAEELDAPHSLKQKYVELKEICNTAELDEMTRLLGIKYTELLKEYNTGQTIESVIVETADVISCLIYAQEELKLGNQYFERVRRESVTRLNELTLKLNKCIGGTNGKRN